MDKVIEPRNTFMESLFNKFVFPFSDKFKFSVKVSLSMALAYLIPLSQGWSQASTAAITVMLIAAMGSVSESITKGLMRVLGTIIGAIVGMVLIAVFPQERLLYLISLSLMVAVPLYLVRAYKGDPSIFMLTAMTMMMVFKNGEVDDVFIFGLDKTYMTIFGITVYTLVGVFLWPVDVEDTSTQSAKKLSTLQAQLFLERNTVKDERETTLTKLLESQEALEKATVDTGSANIDMTQWHSIKYNYSTISSSLTLLSMYDKEATVENSNIYISNYETLENEILQLLNEITLAWESQDEIYVPKEMTLEYNSEKIKTLSHLERASLITTVQEMKKLHNALRKLATKLNRIHSVLPTYFESENIPENSRFLWGDIEHLKGVLVSFHYFLGCNALLDHDAPSRWIYDSRIGNRVECSDYFYPY